MVYVALEYGYRHANVPYWVGHEGMTPPAYLGAAYGTNNGSPSEFACNDGSALTPPAGTPSGPGGTQVTYNGLTPVAPAWATSPVTGCGSAAGLSYNGHGGIWFPAMQRDQQYFDIDLEVKF